MKVNIEIDCTPQEARTFFGLPDLEPMQQAVLNEMQRRMLASMDRFSPEGIMKSWLSAPTDIQNALFGMLSSRTRRSGTKTSDTHEES